MERREFLTNVGISLAGMCAVCMGACSKSNTPGGGGIGGPTNVNFNVDLSTELLNVGNSVVQSGVIVARIAAGNVATSFTAVQVSCTHEGTSINFSPAQSIFICPNHGSQFSTTGSVLVGPATSSLRRYNVSVNGSTLTVTS